MSTEWFFHQILKNGVVGGSVVGGGVIGSVIRLSFQSNSSLDLRKWFTYNWRHNQKTQKQSTYSLKYRLKTKTVYTSLKQTSSVYRLYCQTPKDFIVMANCNPVIPVIDWSEDA